jgi:hypothetical protein
MNLDKVSVAKPATYFEQPARSMYERSKGYDIVATAAGVLVSRTPECTVRLARDEPNIVLIPWGLISEPCSVSDVQPEKAKAK